jgi:hypothetical protein
VREEQIAVLVVRNGGIAVRGRQGVSAVRYDLVGPVGANPRRARIRAAGRHVADDLRVRVREQVAGVHGIDVDRRLGLIARQLRGGVGIGSSLQRDSARERDREGGSDERQLGKRIPRDALVADAQQVLRLVADDLRQERAVLLGCQPLGGNVVAEYKSVIGMILVAGVGLFGETVVAAPLRKGGIITAQEDC